MERHPDTLRIIAFPSTGRDGSEADPTPTTAAEDLATVVDSGLAPAALAGLPADADPLLRELLASCAAFLEGRIDHAAALARDLVGSLENADDVSDELRAAAHAHFERAALILGDPVLLAEGRRLAQTRQDAAARAVPDGPSRGLHEEARRLETLLRTGRTRHASYRRGAAGARLAAILLAMGDPERAVTAATEALDHLKAAGSPREVAFDALTAAAAASLLGRHDEARRFCRTAERIGNGDLVVARAVGEHLAWFGDPAAAERQRREIELVEESGVGSVGPDPTLVDVGLDPSAILRSTGAAAVAAVAAGSVEAAPLVRSLHVLAARLGAALWVGVARALECLATGSLPELPERADPLPATGLLDMVAPAVIARADGFDREARDLVRTAVVGAPERWRPILRTAAAGVEEPIPATEARLLAARLLAEVGLPPDIALLDGALRRLGARGEDASLAKSLAHRLAPRLDVDDLGRVSASLGGAPLGPIGRRKVLALLCFLVTRPDMAATREQVLDALWPDQEPDVAANSLNQTIYFLRRTIDGRGRGRVSPEYLHHDVEVVWLDGQLVGSRSRRCRALIGAARSGGGSESEAASAAVDELAEEYTGRFALDFSYDPWAEAYRESLHASYLAVMEAAVARSLDGDVERGIQLAQRTLAVDPAAEGVELALLRLYRRAGAYAAAAEQYAHYAAVMRDELGVDPPPLDAL